MTVQSELSIVEQRPTRWQEFSTWLTNFEEATNYDPQANANATISFLVERLTPLESRVNELEQNT